jgi:hypothetical protein
MVVSFSVKGYFNQRYVKKAKGCVGNKDFFEAFSKLFTR